jgi:hypothetical protein
MFLNTQPHVVGFHAGANASVWCWKPRTGEIVRLDADHCPIFKNVFSESRRAPLSKFDLLYLNGKDCVRCRSSNENDTARKLLGQRRSRILYLDNVENGNFCSSRSWTWISKAGCARVLHMGNRETGTALDQGEESSRVGFCNFSNSPTLISMAATNAKVILKRFILPITTDRVGFNFYFKKYPAFSGAWIRRDRKS